jgi:prepilin-type N-terminal cleavage/methylation domain-containing protein
MQPDFHHGLSKRDTRCARGFTLVEVLIGSAISLAVIAVSCQLAADAQAAWRSAAARVDLQQRGRVAADLLSRAMREAGAGPLTGPAKTALMRGVPPVVPRRAGRRGAHAADDFRADAFSVIRAVADSEHGVLFVGAVAGATALELAPGSGCARPACGFVEGASLMLVDPSGQYDVFTVTAVDAPVLTVRHHGTNPSSPYPAGTPVLAVESQSFSFDRLARALRVYDGDASDLPLLDEVVAMRVRYWGAAEPPVFPRPPRGEANCLYAADGSYQSALMPALGAGGQLVELTTALLTDGPWCGSGDSRFDADLLRVRRIRIALRFQASDPAVRGAGVQFANPGFARRDTEMVPDRTVEIDATPRNLRLE